MSKYHITVDGTPWCDFSGMAWVNALLIKAPVDVRGVIWCGHTKITTAKNAALNISKVIGPDYSVDIIAKDCPVIP